MVEKSPSNLRYDITLLKEYLKKADASESGNYSGLTCASIVNFKCVCGNITSKKFAYIVRKSGAYCKVCSEKQRQTKIKATNMIKYGCAVPYQNADIMQKGKNTCMELYGVTNPGKKKEFQEKMKQTMLDKYGVEYALQSVEFKNKFTKTLTERFGVALPYQNAELKNKGKETCKKIYGVENPFQNEEIKQKIVKTNITKYGVEYPSQNSDIMLKTQANAKKYKKYIMPSGRIRNVQGYEPFAITELLKSYSEEQIKTDRGDVPRIKYIINDKDRYYFPDIYIPHTKTIIEVKSTWTYKCKCDNITQKKDATEHLGYVYEIWIFGPNGQRVSTNDIKGAS